MCSSLAGFCCNKIGKYFFCPHVMLPIKINKPGFINIGRLSQYILRKFLHLLAKLNNYIHPRSSNPTKKNKPFLVWDIGKMRKNSNNSNLKESL